jgi:taurine dioxygenase
MTRIAKISISPFGLAVEIDGVTGSEGMRGLSAEEKSELVQLYEWDGLLLIRGLSLSLEEQGEVCGIFGPISPPDHPFVSNVRADGILADYELMFHHDIPYVPLPYLGGALFALEVDEGVSPTRFASGYRAYERLPGKLRQKVEGLNSMHVRARAQGRRTRLTDLLPGDPGAVHSVVGHHPVTGRAYLFVDEHMTAGIIGLPEAESDELLEEVFSYLYGDDNVYEHSWRNGDMIVWDNRAVQHGRHALTTPGTRTLQRVNIAALSYFQQCPTDVGSREDLLTARGGDGWSPRSTDSILNAPASGPLTDGGRTAAFR